MLQNEVKVIKVNLRIHGLSTESEKFSLGQKSEVRSQKSGSSWILAPGFWLLDSDSWILASLAFPV
jgi:hypothetical protein